MDVPLRCSPKVELHQHLDCSLSFAFAQSREPNLSYEEFREQFVVPPHAVDFGPYERCANRAVALLQSADALTDCVHDLFDQLAVDNVVYAEIRFAPFLHVRDGMTPHAIVAAVDAAVRAASAASGIDAGVLLCTLRQYDEEQGLTTARLAKEFAGSSVLGIDLAGDEIGYPIGAHVAAYDFARREGVARTAHAGEAGGPESVWETLRLLQPQRLGHGVRSIEDPALVDHLRANRIHLEVCPSSNVHTGVCATYAAHPVDRLRRAGLALGINTDGRTISDVNLDAEYQRMAATFGWTRAEFDACNLAAIDAAFAPDEVRARVRARLEAASLAYAT